MSLQGLIRKTTRTINRKLRAFGSAITQKLRRSPGLKSDETEVPRSWLPRSRELRGVAQKKPTLYVKKGKVVVARHVHHWPWLRNFKRGLAAILLLVNFSLSQFLIATQGAVFAFFFFGNVFILIDYLWRTRRKEE